MSLRFHAFALTVFGMAFLIAPLAVPARAAEPASKDAAKPPKSWTSPRTPDGQPGPPGLLDQRHLHSLGTPQGTRRQGVLYRSRSDSRREKETAGRAQPGRRRHPLRQCDLARRQVGQGFAEPANVHRVRSARWTAPSFVAARTEARGGTRGLVAPIAKPSISAEVRTLGERCITWGADGPPLLGSTYNANFQILQTADSVVILTEMIHSVRTIFLDGRPHLPASIHQLAGDSRGHWEGDTLVVDSTNFSDKTNFRGPPATARQDIFSSPRVARRRALHARQ